MGSGAVLPGFSTMMSCCKIVDVDRNLRALKNVGCPIAVFLVCVFSNGWEEY